MAFRVNFDTVLWISGTVAEAAVIALLLYRRAWFSQPVFLIYISWTLIGSVGAFTVLRGFSHSLYLSFYFAYTIVDSVLLFGVLVELGWSILRPLRSSLPRSSLVFIGIIILVCGAAIWPFAAVPGAGNQPHQVAILMHMQQTFSILRIVVFVVLAGCSHMLSIGWRDRELQIATGLGFTSMVGLTVAILHTHQTTREQYSNLNRFVVAGYLCSLLYWTFCFSQQEEKRRDFSPQMQSMLLAVAGAARSTRIGLTDIKPGKPTRER